MDGTFRVNIAGLRAVRREIAAPLCEAVAITLKDAVVDEMESAPARSGRTYLKPGTKTPYTASAPDEPPAIREARYRDSWKNTPGVETPTGAYAAAYSDETTEDGKHLMGAILEFGAPKADLAPRPHIRPGLEKAEADVRDLVRKASSR